MGDYDTIEWRPARVVAGSVGLVLLTLGTCLAPFGSGLSPYAILVGSLLLVGGACSSYVRTRDDGDRITVSGGPLPFPWRVIQYQQIEAADPATVSTARFYMRWLPGLPAVHAARPGTGVRLRLKARLGLLRPRTAFIGAPDAGHLASFLRHAAATRRQDYYYEQPKASLLIAWLGPAAFCGLLMVLIEPPMLVLVVPILFVIALFAVTEDAGLVVVGVGDRLTIRYCGLVYFVVPYHSIKKVEGRGLSWWQHHWHRESSLRGGGHRGLCIKLARPVPNWRWYRGRLPVTSISLTLYDADGLTRFLNTKAAQFASDD